MKITSIVLIIAGVFAFYSFNTSAGKEKKPEGIDFHTGTWQQAIEKAKAENKTIFLDAYASWCGPCKLMSSKTFTSKEVGKFFNKNFINVKMDMEKGEGVALSKKYPITAYPTLLFINAEGEVIAKTIGYYRTDDFLKLGNEVSKIK